MTCFTSFRCQVFQWLSLSVERLTGAVETAESEYVWTYCAPSLLQLTGRHHGFELLATQVSKEGGLYEITYQGNMPNTCWFVAF